jgi:16S rRNA (uracil1498-N3)-methyltransferase
MRRRRWIADEVSGNRAALVGPHADHLVRVLRARVGQEFDISTGSIVRRGRITSITEDRVELELDEEVPQSSPVDITLALAIFKFDRMEWAIEKCTELGVTRISPLISRRTDPHLATAAVKRVERWRRIARAASEQSRRVAPPEITEPMKLEDAARLTDDLRILLSETEATMTLKNALRLPRQFRKIALAVGPEGGWMSSELHKFAELGWIAASLGPMILRAETAAIAGIALIVSEAQLRPEV